MNGGGLPDSEKSTQKVMMIDEGNGGQSSQHPSASTKVRKTKGKGSTKNKQSANSNNNTSGISNAAANSIDQQHLKMASIASH